MDVIVMYERIYLERAIQLAMNLKPQDIVVLIALVLFYVICRKLEERMAPEI